jgi:hypothetical protein
MKRALLATPCLLGVFVHDALARGVSPYLPLNLEPEIESQIERVLVLGDKPTLVRPIAAASVLDALPKACAIDAVLCDQVRRYLARYTQSSGITHASIAGGSSSDDVHVIPNRHGLSTSSSWNASAQGYIQPSDYLLVSAGGIAYDDHGSATGSMVSLGFDRAQLDIGYRDHWLSPFTDSAMLMSTEARTMPSVTLSNYVPLTRFGLTYELFAARMAKSSNIRFQGGYTAGHPRIAGLHLATEPVPGWSLGFNRIMQYGGGARNTNSFSDIFDAFFQPSKYDNADAQLSLDDQFGNQAASFTSRFIYPGRVPFSVYFEYAGEDTSRGKNYLLGNTDLSAGIHFPRLFRRFDLTYEISEWQNNWYIHGVYQDGLTNGGLVIGHWGADQRVFNNDVGARTQMVNLGWNPSFGGTLDLRYRTIENEAYGRFTYERGHDVTVRYSRPVKSFTLGAEYYQAKDVFGQSFSQGLAFVRYSPHESGFLSAVGDAMSSAETAVSGAEVFIDAGANANQVRVDVSDEAPRYKTERKTEPHFALGARRAVSDHSDFGVRVEYDEVNSRSLIGVRALDYRYRIGGHLAVSGFVGAARYDLETPAYGVYLGTGLQWRNLLPGWDIGADFRYATKVARDHLLSTDPQSTRPDSFYDITSTTLYLTKHF